jgi:UDP-glucose 4-epimerase
MGDMKSVTVTGGAGFIGSHLVDLLVRENYRVRVIDDLSNGRMENIRGHLENGTIEFHKIDLSRYDLLEEVESIVRGCTYVFHLAALADIVPSIQHPVKYHKANIDGTVNILEAVRRNSIEKFVYTASSSCYGVPDVYPTPETAPVNPEYPYALTKYLGEQYALHWHKIYNLPVVSLRLFNVYGPRARTSGTYGAVFGVFLAQKLNNKPLTVVGDGTQTRDFTFVTDIVEGFYLAAKSDLSGEIINLGSGNTTSVSRLTELLGGEVIHIPKRPGEPACTFADNAKAARLLGYKPKVSFEEGVGIMLEHIEDWRQAPVWTPDAIDTATKDWFKYLSR